MTRNVTLRLDEAVLRRARQEAVQKNRSLSQWLSDLNLQSTSRTSGYEAARRRALKRLQKGFHLGGKPLTREEIYAERLR